MPLHDARFAHRGLASPAHDLLPDPLKVLEGLLTYVYHLFPNVILATFPEQLKMVAVEPLAPDRMKFVVYTLTGRREDETAGMKEVERASDFSNTGAIEDAAVALSIQRGLASDANEFFELGRFEGALTDFHRSLDEAIEACRDDAAPRSARSLEVFSS